MGRNCWNQRMYLPVKAKHSGSALHSQCGVWTSYKRTIAGLWRHLLLTGYVTLPFSIWALFFHGNLSRIAEVMPPKQHRNKSTIILDANLDPSRLWMKIHLCHTCASCWLLMLALYRISFAIIILAKNLWRFWKSTTVPLIQWNEITKLWL